MATLPQSLKNLLDRWRKHLFWLGVTVTMLALMSLTQGGRNADRAEALAAYDLTRAVMQDETTPLIDPALLSSWQRVHRVLEASGLSAATQLSAQMPVRFTYQGPPSAKASVVEALVRLGVQPIAKRDGRRAVVGAVAIHVSSSVNEQIAVSGRFIGVDRKQIGQHKARIAGPWWSVLPPLFAVLIALAYRRVLFALGGAVWLGALLVKDMDVGAGTAHMTTEYIFASLSSASKLYILSFTLALVGMIHLCGRSGGNQGLVDVVGKLAKSARSTRVVTGLMGLIVFFDDYANALIVGSSARSMTDKMKISREKLAYIVDSTAAPVAGIALVSTWVGYEVGLFESLSGELQLGRKGFDIFLDVLVTRFYCFFALGVVFINAWSSRDFGPMLKAERRATFKGQLTRPGATLSESLDNDKPHGDLPPRWFNAAIPIAVTVLSVVIGVAWSGNNVLVEAGRPAADLMSGEGWRSVFSEAESSKVMLYAALLGSLSAYVLVVGQRLMSPVEALKVWFSGMRLMTYPLGILLLAWCMQLTTKDLGTSYYLISALEPVLQPAVLPMAVFLIAAAVAFATGTSWGTMGILLPALIPMAWAITDQSMMLTLLCMGAILDGAIFGDHCSPISDTTVMSSIACGCDHIDHVRTQLPYAVTSMMVAGIFGYLARPLDVPLFICYIAGFASIFAIFYTIGRPISPADSASLTEA